MLFSVYEQLLKAKRLVEELKTAGPDRDTLLRNCLLGLVPSGIYEEQATGTLHAVLGLAVTPSGGYSVIHTRLNEDGVGIEQRETPLEEWLLAPDTLQVSRFVLVKAYTRSAIESEYFKYVDFSAYQQGAQMH